MIREFGAEKYHEIIETQENIKLQAQAVIDKMRPLIPRGKDIKIEYRSTPFKPGGLGRLIEGWEENNEAKIGIYLPQELNEVRVTQKFSQFLVGHEVSHLFEKFFKEYKGKLSEEEIKESLDAKLDNPIIETGQTEVITDLITLMLLEGDTTDQDTIAESYLNLIKYYYLPNPEALDLRDDIRFSEIVKYLVNKKKVRVDDANDILVELQKKIDSEMLTASELDMKMFKKYQEFIRDITERFKEDFSQSGQIEDFIKRKSQNQAE